MSEFVPKDLYTGKGYVLVSRSDGDPLPVALPDGETIVGDSSTNSGVSTVAVGGGGGVQSVTAGDASITIGGTLTNPTVAVTPGASVHTPIENDDDTTILTGDDTLGTTLSGTAVEVTTPNDVTLTSTAGGSLRVNVNSVEAIQVASDGGSSTITSMRGQTDFAEEPTLAGDPLPFLPLPTGTASAGQVPVATGTGNASAWGDTQQILFADVCAGFTSTTLSGLQDFDGLTGADGQTVFVPLNGNGSQVNNGLWVMHSGAWTRPSNFANGFDAATCLVKVNGGSKYLGTIFEIGQGGARIVGTASLRWRAFIPSGGNLTDIPAAGEIIYGSGNAAMSRVPAGTAGNQVLTWPSSGTSPSWVAGSPSPAEANVAQIICTGTTATDTGVILVIQGVQKFNGGSSPFAEQIDPTHASMSAGVYEWNIVTGLTGASVTDLQILLQFDGSGTAAFAGNGVIALLSPVVTNGPISVSGGTFQLTADVTDLEIEIQSQNNTSPAISDMTVTFTKLH